MNIIECERGEISNLRFLMKIYVNSVLEYALTIPLITLQFIYTHASLVSCIPSTPPSHMLSRESLHPSSLPPFYLIFLIYLSKFPCLNLLFYSLRCPKSPSLFYVLWNWLEVWNYTLPKKSLLLPILHQMTLHHIQFTSAASCK